MKNSIERSPRTFSKIFLFISFNSFILNMSCDSKDEDCTKTAVVRDTYFLNNQQYYLDRTIELPCSFPDPEPLNQIDPPELDGFTYDILFYEFIPDTGNNTSRWRFEIQLNNPNDYKVTGLPILTVRIGELTTSQSYSDKTTVPCFELGANSSCTLSYDQESSLDLGLINDIELLNVQYFLTNQN